MEEPEPSDQLPEEGPSEQVPEDDAGSDPERGGGESRDDEQSGEPDQATGNPGAAG